MSIVAHRIGLGTVIRKRKMSEEQRIIRDKEIKDYNRAYSKEHPNKPENIKAIKKVFKEKHPDYQKKWREKNKNAHKGYRLKSAYGITIQDLDRMKKEQKYLCALCGKEEKKMTRGLCVDHNHSTKKIRALLCTQSNALIGYAKENIIILKNAIKYLKHHGQPTN